MHEHCLDFGESILQVRVCGFNPTHVLRFYSMKIIGMYMYKCCYCAYEYIHYMMYELVLHVHVHLLVHL